MLLLLHSQCCRQTKLPSSFALYVFRFRDEEHFHRLTRDNQDRELDKVNAFYTVKESEV